MIQLARLAGASRNLSSSGRRSISRCRGCVIATPTAAGGRVRVAGLSKTTDGGRARVAGLSKVLRVVDLSAEATKRFTLMLMMPPAAKQIISLNASRIGGSQPQWDASALVDGHALGDEELGAHGRG